MNGTEYLFVQNGNIYYKEANKSSYGQWVKASRNGMGGGKVIKLAAGDKLYALVAQIIADEDEGENIVDKCTLYHSGDGNNWTQVTNVPLTATGNRLYSLTGTSSSVAYIQTKNGRYSLTNGNGVPDADASHAYKIQAGEYTANGRTITGPSGFSRDVGSHIYSMALTSDCIVVGTASGLKYITFSGSEITVANSASALSSYYEVHCVFVVNSGKNTARNSDIYASAIFSGTTSSGASSDNEGLWAYYPGRGSWNRE